MKIKNFLWKKHKSFLVENITQMRKMMKNRERKNKKVWGPSLEINKP